MKQGCGKLFRRLLGLTVLVVVVLGIFLWQGLPKLNAYRTHGEIQVVGLQAPASVVRDAQGMAYARAQSLDDAVFLQGFLTAQDRLFNMEVVRRFAQGRVTELVGERARDLDIRHRTIGFHYLARRHAELLDEPTRHFFQRYVDGVNSYLEGQRNELPKEFDISGHQPTPWNVEDSLSILYLMAWNSAANLKHEVITQGLIETLGPTAAAALRPLNVNPDAAPPTEDPNSAVGKRLPKGQAQNPRLSSKLSSDMDAAAGIDVNSTHLGSNNWVVGAERSAGGAPILAGDPHLDPRTLPGVWYPIALIWPENRAVGVQVPGLPGMAAGRTEHVALAMTNAYGDAQDLVLEVVDASGRYREGDTWLDFETRKEVLRIKADEGFRDETIEVRSSIRGPLVAGVLPGLDTTSHPMVLRWAAAETMTPHIGFLDLLHAKDVDDVTEALSHLPMIVLNFVYADVGGNIAWHVTGGLPTRVEGAGTSPWSMENGDPWTGWINFDELPHARNPDRRWLATANHYTVTSEYPHYYTDAAASSYRYRRILELLSGNTTLEVDDHWRFQRDTKNLLAEKLAPIFARALLSEDQPMGETAAEMGRLLESWDHHDRVDAAAPLLFQEILRQLAIATFKDELGSDMAERMLGNLYYWQERLQRMLLENHSAFFDDVTTPDQLEDRDTLIRRAAGAALRRLEPLVGSDPKSWSWGDLHHLTLVNPLRREGVGRDFLGTGALPMGGSAETLYRAWYDFNSPYAITFTASLRMVVDLSDDEKIRAVLPGGVVGRTFHPHQKDQVEPFMSGESRWWWFSDRAIAEHAVATMSFEPQTPGG